MLPFTSTHNPKDPVREQFFALQISPEVVKSAIWAIYNDKPQVLSVGVPAKWDNQNLESLMTAADQSISDTTARLDPTGQLQPQKVIFGLPFDWVSEDKITPTRLAIIKSLSAKLALKPVGFVVSVQAMLQHIHSLEGTPPSVILLGFWPSSLEITVIRLGKNAGTFSVLRSPNPVDDVLEGLHRFNLGEMLPSRMLLYDSGADLEEIRQLLLSYPWQSSQRKLSFLHFPKIESLASDFSIRSIALSGGSEVAHALGLIAEDPLPPPVQPAEPTDLGFVEHPQPSQPAEDVYIPLPVSSPARKTQLVIGLVTALVTLVAGLFAAYWYLPQAKVLVTVDPKLLNHQFLLTADTKIKAIDTAGLLIPASILEITVTNSKSEPTTGTKTIGEKATSTVTIFNGTEGPYKFPSGTLLTSPSGLKFHTTETVTVASSSGVVPNLQYGKAQAKAAASAIGPEYNLAADTSFRVATFSQKDIAAQNETAFSGGSSQKVKSVSASDITKLRLGLTNELKTKALADLRHKVDSGQTIIDQTLATVVQSESFDHKQDDQAEDLKLDLAVTAQGLVISKQDLNQAIDSQIQPLIPTGYAADDDRGQSFTIQKAGADSVLFQVSISDRLLPKIDNFTATGNLAGKSLQAARDYLSKIPGVTQVEFAISPALPRFITTLPHVPGRIHIEIKSQP